MKKPVVAVLKTTPETVLEDIPRLMQMAGVKDGAFARSADDFEGQYFLAFPFFIR